MAVDDSFQSSTNPATEQFQKEIAKAHSHTELIEIFKLFKFYNQKVLVTVIIYKNI